MNKLLPVPYYMVTFTLPAQLRGEFFGPHARDAYDLFFQGACRALSEKLATEKGLRAPINGFTAVLHTWNQRLEFHPHIHCLVAGAGLNAQGHFVRVKNAARLVHLDHLKAAFRQHCYRLLKTKKWIVDPAVWNLDWGVHIQPAGTGAAALKYLGTYVTRTRLSLDPTALRAAGALGNRHCLPVEGSTTRSHREADIAGGGVCAALSASCVAQRIARGALLRRLPSASPSQPTARAVPFRHARATGRHRTRCAQGFTALLSPLRPTDATARFAAPARPLSRTAHSVRPAPAGWTPALRLDRMTIAPRNRITPGRCRSVVSDARWTGRKGQTGKVSTKLTREKARRGRLPARSPASKQQWNWKTTQNIPLKVTPSLYTPIQAP
jgi:hypothetical protein